MVMVPVACSLRTEQARFCIGRRVCEQRTAGACANRGACALESKVCHRRLPGSYWNAVRPS
eukprot:scaffold109763_cov74-Phaeocystis_antarctica.AAC.2